ncbi:efflux RND transporter periplasmic adaptor subunit [Shewanella sp. YLB-07]|uniref:efflux RND transporter periplasmic adaptor subunit n=1 Tax=Shewanella sp. YLB-07 TaxID=2601268 RepID=UPI001883B2F5|nr:efflux RND transporter periplasmic adaptor subunit [Shewanella sp. YLB-07]
MSASSHQSSLSSAVFITALLPLIFLGVSTPVLAAMASSNSIETIRVSNTEQTKWVELDATLEAVKAATVSAQTSGRILRLNYDVNDIVPKGAALLEITSKEQGAELASAEAGLARAVALNTKAQQTKNRYEALFPQGAISQGKMDEAIARATSAEQEVSAAKANIIRANESLTYTTVSAPFSGIVTQRHVELGETVSPSQPLLSGFSLSQMRAITQVPQRYIDALKRQPRFKLSLKDGREFSSDKLTIFSFADPLSHSYQVRISLPEGEPNLMPGMWAKARFSSGIIKRITIPKSALIERGELSAVYRKLGQGFVLNQVRIGVSDNHKAEILSGLDDGDVIALDAYRVLLEQQASK